MLFEVSNDNIRHTLGKLIDNGLKKKIIEKIKNDQNLTPHPVVVAGIKSKPEGMIPRLSQKSEFVSYFDGVPLVRMTFGTSSDCRTSSRHASYRLGHGTASSSRRKDLASPGDLNQG
jgi:hypothetical protein